MSPFASKSVGTEKLYKRVHGITIDCTVGINVFEFDCPYPHAKITGMEVLWAPEETTADFLVLDDDLGTYSTVPNYLLNQFGFTAGISKDYYLRDSAYDADVYLNMTLVAKLTLPVAKKVCVNFILDEAKV
jgi:hypothetical protein